MLVNLYIKNYILIQELSVSLSENFNVFTGETGAGKSMLVDALNFVTGARSSASVVGSHGNRALVEASFLVPKQSNFYQFLDSMGYIEDRDDLIIVSREMTRDGRNVCRINGRTVNVSTMRDGLSQCVDIHSQHETQYLLNSKNQLQLVDTYMNQPSLLAEYTQAYEAYNQVHKAIEQVKNTALSDYELEFAKAQLAEIEALKPTVDDYETIKEELKTLDNFEKTKATLNTIEAVLSGEEDVLTKLYEIKDTFLSVPSLKDAFDDVYYRLEDIAYQISKLNSDTVFDAYTYDALQARIYKYNQCIRKYGSLEQVFDKRDELSTIINAVEHQDVMLEDLNNDLKQAKKVLDEVALRLRAQRIKAALKLQKEVMVQCHDLMLEHARFNIEFTEVEPSKSGCDQLTFMVSMNKGEPLQSLASTASGGELSRVMLAMKVIFSRLQGITTLVFDEIDTGVSGKVSLKIGEKMKQISQDTQVLTITHYGTVAAVAHEHYLIVKSQDEDSTITSVEHLNTDKRIHQLALMMSGNEDAVALRAAEQLLQQGQSL